MKIALASDHGGFDFKEYLKIQLLQDGHEVQDFGCNSRESCDYPDFGIPAARSVSEGKNERAILICTNGIGMTILANKICGIRAALVYSLETAQVTRQHHDSNVLCLGAQEFEKSFLMEIVKIWLVTLFEDKGRHLRRIGKIMALEN